MTVPATAAGRLITPARGVGAVLHAVRVRGPSNTAELERMLCEEVQTSLAALESQGLLAPSADTPVRWRLTEAGRARSDECLRTAQPELADRLEGPAAEFLAHDMAVKSLCSAWQDTGAADGAARWDILADLEEIVSRVQPALAAVAGLAPRFGGYVARLRESLMLARDDPRHVASPFVDSFHSVWFECHEDLILCRGLERGAG